MSHVTFVYHMSECVNQHWQSITFVKAFFLKPSFKRCNALLWNSVSNNTSSSLLSHKNHIRQSWTIRIPLVCQWPPACVQTSYNTATTTSWLLLAHTLEMDLATLAWVAECTLIANVFYASKVQVEGRWWHKTCHRCCCGRTSRSSSSWKVANWSMLGWSFLFLYPP